METSVELEAMMEAAEVFSLPMRDGNDDRRCKEISFIRFLVYL